MQEPDLALEGGRWPTVRDFIEMMGKPEDALVYRLEFRYV